jgi:hypothetical protein
MADPVFAGEAGRLAVEMFRQHLIQQIDILGMDAIEPFVDAGADLVLGTAEHGFPPGRIVDMVFPNVPVPQAVIHAPRRQGIAFLADPQRFFRGPLGGAHLGIAQFAFERRNQTGQIGFQHEIMGAGLEQGYRRLLADGAGDHDESQIALDPMVDIQGRVRAEAG